MEEERKGICENATENRIGPGNWLGNKKEILLIAHLYPDPDTIMKYDLGFDVTN